MDEQQVPYTHPADQPFNWVRVRMIGGKSNFWARMSFRLSDYEFKAKDHDGFGENWPIDHATLAPFYERAEAIFRVSGPARKDWLSCPTATSLQTIRRFRSGAALRRRREAARYPSDEDPAGARQRATASSWNLLLPDAAASGNLTIVPNAVVRQVTVDKNAGKADGAIFHDRHSGREMHVKAKAVVVGASCLESTRIVLNSGIANSSGALGHYLHDQFYLTGSVVAIVPEARDGKARIGGSGYIPRFRNIKTKEKNFIRGYALDFSFGATPDAKYFGSWGAELQKDLDSVRAAGFSCTSMGEVLPRYENYVAINKNVKDAWGIPVLDFHCKYGENEAAMAKDAVATMEEVCHAAKFEVLSRNDKVFAPGYSIHELGTCRMGDDPKKSVLNKWNQSHDVKNLFVVDGSSFVTGGSQNPTMTILALSMRASEYLADQMKVGGL